MNFFIAKNQGNKLVSQLFAKVGTGEPFVAEILGLIDILNATSYGNRKEINDKILEILVMV